MRITSAKVQDFENKHTQIVRQGSPESMVLLKNSGVLPLTGVKTVALYGNGARETIKGGTGSGDVNVRHFVTVEEGLKTAGLKISTQKWLDSYSSLKNQVTENYYSKLLEEAKQVGLNPMIALMGKNPLEPDYDFPLDGAGDAAIYVLARNSGEGSDRKVERGDIKLTTSEKRDILLLANQYPQFVLVLNVGGFVDISEVAAQVPAILILSQLGTETGIALADVLLGKAYPSGKLTTTWAPIEEYSSTTNFGNNDDTPYKEGIYVGYRYFDSMNITPSYEFGYGLGYTNFTITTENVRVVDDQVAVSVRIKNTGHYPGKEVVQVYYSAPQGQLDKPYQELATYAKTSELAASETTKLTLSFPVNRMASYLTTEAQMLLEQGNYLIRVGNSSRNTRIVAKLFLKHDVVTAQYKNVGGQVDFTDFVPNTKPYTYAGETTERQNAPIVTLNPATLTKETVDYSDKRPTDLPTGEHFNWSEVVQGKKTVADFVAGLTDEELARVLTGNYTDTGDGDVLSIIGNAGSTVAGAAGETTHYLERLGVPVLVMADGPAGLRLSPIYTKTANGKLKEISSSFANMAGTAATDETTYSSDTPRFYQYCTAIPIGTAIAQSWNTDLARKYGDIVGQEMTLFNVDIWLAPALNIHRSPLDGRDFEYYSEDPLVSGFNAAAITQGVQKHPGKATTIKHFLANNQETNRQFSNSIINERPLREIYLKGFELAVKIAQPHTLMTSYNLLNGIHVPNRYDILTEVLRDEWNFKGFAMTDWFTTGNMGGLEDNKYGSTSAAGEIYAGNDMTMPGLPTDTKSILTALHDHDTEQKYVLTRGQLQAAAVRILKVILLLSQAR